MTRTTTLDDSDQGRTRHGVALEQLVSDICSHIREPMTIDDLVEYIASNDYSAELALQHALLLLSR